MPTEICNLRGAYMGGGKHRCRLHGECTPQQCNGCSDKEIGPLPNKPAAAKPPEIEPSNPLPGSCRYLGKYADQTVTCGNCKGNVALKVYLCHNARQSGKGFCTLVKPADGFACCNGRGGTPCAGYAPPNERKPLGLTPPNPAKRPHAFRWACGVTTVPDRRKDLLPKTLASLKAAGFAAPRLFVDGSRDAIDWQNEFGLAVTCRFPAVRVAVNWYLTLAELYHREPQAERFAIFQDDCVFCANVRPYLDLCRYPDNGYWNLYTFPQNEPPVIGEAGFYQSPAHGEQGYQRGLGAVALVFSRDAALEVLGSQHMLERPQDADRGWRAVDGGIVSAMNKAGYREFCHSPGLCQHTGLQSSMDNMPHPLCNSFPGESFDALTLAKDKVGA